MATHELDKLGASVRMAKSFTTYQDCMLAFYAADNSRVKDMLLQRLYDLVDKRFPNLPENLRSLCVMHGPDVVDIVEDADGYRVTMRSRV